jgi:pSer/pThr/pTyr-binding forkhead associated (FHA) protein
MDSPLIQLRFKGRLLQTLSFQGDTLRIGRMKENDIVISNASVSRFHALLRREHGRVILEDSGSGNGCYVNGTRIANSVALEPGDEILIGKHQLVLTEAGDEDAPPSELARDEKNDAWDASKTYFFGAGTPAEMHEDSVSEPAAVTDPEPKDELLVAAAPEAAAEEAPPEETEPETDDAVVEVTDWEPIEDAEPELIEDVEPELIEDVAPELIDVSAEAVETWSSETSDAAEEDEPAESVSAPDPGGTGGESPFEFGVDVDLAGSARGIEAELDAGDYDVEPTDEGPKEDGELAAVLAGPAAPEVQSSQEPTWHAGLIIQKQGKLDRIISWDRDRLVAGRSRECEILLNQAEISRRHAMFVREDGCYEVRDLESINGFLVNGEKTRDRTLEVGDVVKIEGFELTFLLDRRPIAGEIKTEEVAVPVAAEAEGGFDMTMIDENLPIDSAVTEPSADQEPLALTEEAAAEIAEDSVFEPGAAEGEELIEVEAISPELSESEDPGVAVVTADVLSFELRVRLEDLPEPLRAALAEVDVGDLRLPVEVVLKTDG